MPTLALPSEPMTFCRVDLTNPLDPWSDECAEHISILLQSHSDQSLELLHPNVDFRLPLLTVLYIDSTKAGGRAPGRFAELLKLPNFPDTTLGSWGSPDSYDHAKLAMYWYMALFQDPLHAKNDLIDGIMHIFERTMNHCSELRVSTLNLLGVIMKHLRATTTSLDISREDPPSGDNLTLSCTLPSGTRPLHRIRASNPWVLLHLDTLFVQSSIFVQEDRADLGCPETPEKVFIAKARLALYDEPEEGGEHEHVAAHKPDPKITRSAQVHLSGASVWLLSASLLLSILTAPRCSFQKLSDMSGLKTLLKCFVMGIMSSHGNSWWAILSPNGPHSHLLGVVPLRQFS